MEVPQTTQETVVGGGIVDNTAAVGGGTADNAGHGPRGS